jgi:hypothetical protein
MIFIFNNFAANTTGKATYHHLQKTTCILYFFKAKIDWKIPYENKIKSHKFLQRAEKDFSLLRFQELIEQK